MQFPARDMAAYDEWEHLRTLLCALQAHVIEQIRPRQETHEPGYLARVASVTDADTIYAIDEFSETAIHAWFEENWPSRHAVELVMEGNETEPITFPTGTPVAETRWKCILDPIDGTRNLMYDKRSAWILAGIAPQKGPQTGLQDIVVAAMTELPSTKAWRSDRLSAIRGHGVTARAHDVRKGGSTLLRLAPSQAEDCRHAFATVTRFFPAGLEATGRLEEQLWQRLYAESPGGSPLVFNDQYLTTGGQLYELIAGHDRFTADLRPIVFSKLNIPQNLTCHPYDMAALLIAQEAGVLIEDPQTGEPVNAPLDTVSPVAWVGYANPRLAESIRPVLQELIEEFLGA